MSREIFNYLATALSVVMVIYTFILVYLRQAKPVPRPPLGMQEKIVTCFWILGPPLFFWLDWVAYWPKLSEEERSAVEHTHDLARNIWLGLFVILAYAFFNKAPGGGDE